MEVEPHILHLNELVNTLRGNDLIENIYRAAELISAHFVLQKNNSGGGSLFVAGNGGSAAIANHLVCDYSKGIEEETKYKPRVFSLSSNESLITAIANDIDFSKIYLNQIVGRVSKEDLFILISSSGTSKNIVQLCEYLNKNEIPYISIFGFNSELQLSNNATIKIHINSFDYGVIEDASQIIMHTMKKLIIERLNHKNI